MAERMYDIDFDDDHRMLHLSNRGIWTVGIHVKFVGEVFAKAIPARIRHGSIAVLGDLREHPVQPAELNGLSEALIARALRLNNGPIALVVGSVLGKMQAERVLTGPTVRIFLDMNEANDWLRHCWIDPGYVITDRIRQHLS